MFFDPTDKSKLLAVVDGLRGFGPLYTAPFVIQAREKKRPPTPAAAAAAAPPPLPLAEPPTAAHPEMYDAHGHLLPMMLPTAPPATAAVAAAAAAAARAAAPEFLAFVQQRSTEAAAEICRM